MLALDLVQTVALAAVVLFAGYGIKRHVPLLTRYNIPAPVVGGLLVAAILSVGQLNGVALLQFDTTLQTPLQTPLQLRFQQLLLRRAPILPRRVRCRCASGRGRY